MVAERTFMEARKAGIHVVGEEPEAPSRLVGTMTGASREVVRNLKEIRYPPNVRAFLDHLTDHTFCIAHLHREWNHDAPGSWCHFDLAAWADALRIRKSNLLRIRKRLVDDGVIFFTPDETRAGRGQIDWNLDFSQWKPLQGERSTWGGKREGSGRKKQASEHTQLEKRNQLDSFGIEQTANHTQLEKRNQLETVSEAKVNQDDYALGPTVIILKTEAFSENPPEAAPAKQADLFKREYVQEKDEKTKDDAGARERVVRIDTPPPMPASAPPGHSPDEVLETLHTSSGWKTDRGKDLLLLKALQDYPTDWLFERAEDYALADGNHTYNGFKGWIKSQRSQDKLRQWEQEREAKRQRAAKAQTNGYQDIRASLTQQDREANALARADAEKRRQTKQEKPGYLG